MFQISKRLASPASDKNTFLKRVFAAAFFIFLFFSIVSLNIGTQFRLLQAVRTFPMADKFAHITMYGMLALLVNMAWNYAYVDLSTRWLRGQYFQLGSFAVLFLSLFEEFSQQFFPTRTIDAWDAMANLVGVILFTIISVQFAQSNRFNLRINVFNQLSEKTGQTNQDGGNS